MTFRIEGSTTLAHAAFLHLEEVHVVGPDGERFDRVVVRHPGSVTIVPIDSEGRAILVRQYRAALDRHLLELPAGKCDVADEPPEATAERELIEEVGVRPGHLVRLGAIEMSPGMSDEVSHLFLASNLEPAKQDASLRHEEAAMTTERVELDAVAELVAHGELTDAASIVGLMLARERLRGAE